MKKINKLIIFLVLVLAGFGLCSNLLSSKNAYAESSSPSEYFSIQKEYYSSTDEAYLPRENAQAIKENSAVFLQDGQRIRVGLGVDKDNIEYSKRISSLTYKITVNDIVFDNQASAAMEVYGMSLSRTTDGINFDLVINPEIANTDEFNYGKYTFEFTYYYTAGEGVPVYTTYSYSVYILAESDYFGNAQFYNALNNSTSSIFYSNYSKANLMYLGYDYRFYNLKVVRVHQGLTTTTTLKYLNGSLAVSSLDEQNATTNNHNVSINTNGTRAFVVFRNLGVYYLTYELINPFGNCEVITEFYEDPNAPTLTQTAYVFGYQMYYTSQGGLEEFKNVDASSPWIISGSSNTADVTYLVKNGLADLAGITEDAIAKTNQAPVYPQTNAIINANGSEYYYFKDYTTFKANVPNIAGVPTYANNATDAYKVEKYSATPLSNAGIYIVKLSYTYSSYEGGEIVQYFLFRITNDAPVVNIFTKDDSENAVMLTNDEFTYKDVYITKSSLGVFDSESTLIVYKDAAFNGVYDSGTLVEENKETVFTQTARYKVELSYGNSNQKGFVTYFTIDKEQISEIEFKNLNVGIGSRYYVGSTLSAPYLTNNAVALSWKEKASGAIVTAEYKYFATKYSANNEASLSSDMLKVLYNSNQLTYSIPSTHILSYAGGNVPVSDYSNTYGKTSLIDSEIISAGGLYIFHIYDNTGAEGQYFAIFIDTTPNSILTETDDIYKLAPSSEITTKDTTIYFGSTKLIKIDFDINGIWDEWLSNYLNDSNSTTYQAQKYLKIGISNKVYYLKDTTIKSSLTLSATTPGYGYEIKAQNTDGSMNEAQYIFYTIAESVKTDSIYAKDSFEYYQQNSSATYWITFTTDNSRMTVSYAIEKDTQYLGQLPIVTEQGIKTTYYQPTATETLAKAGEILKLSYCIKPSDILEVDSIILYYYEFTESDSKGTYTFSLNNPSSSITIYEKGTINRGTEIDGELNTFIYEINKETYNGSNTRTKSGRYEIVRTYTEESVINENDPVKRKLVFIVDRNGIISAPVIGSDGNSTYYTGGAIQLQVINRYGINYYDEQTLHFYDIYYASKLSNDELVPVLTTNFLPVTVYIPRYKYGYIDSVDGSPVFKVEDSIVRYPTQNGGYDYYGNYELTATVQYYNTKREAVGNPYVYNTALSSNFLTTDGSGNSIIAYNQEGYYEVIIKTKSEDPTKPVDEFRFVFQIKYDSPDYEILDIENTPITSVTTNSETIYYTNKKTVRISWEDSPSEYLARINQNAIQYIINGVTRTIDTNVTPVQSSGDNKYYIDLDLERLGAYVDNTNVYITLQYYGKLEDYSSSEHFSKTVTLKVDLQAPVYNVKNLIASTGLEFYSLRKYVDGYKYNTSLDTGLFRYFAYTVDKSTFESMVLSPVETGYDYCKLYYRAFVKYGVNTKYIAGGNNETDITLSDLTGQTDGTIFDSNAYTSISELLSSYSNIYIEFIEEDFAGNRTVYTIYLSDMDGSTEDVLSYSYLTNSSANKGDTEKPVAFNQLQRQMSLYSKYSFNLESLDLIQNDELADLSWQLVTVNGVLYVKSPYSNGRFYIYNTYNENKENQTYSLKDLTTLYSSTSSQSITLTLVPIYQKIDLSVYVLNKTLEVYTLSEVMDSNLYEGLLVKLPSAKTNEDNLLYATSLSIKSKLSGTFEYTSTIDAKYLKEEQELPTLNSMRLSYVTYKNARFLQIEMLGNISLNDYFVYTITDNFGEQYSIVHIYGQTEISEPILSDGTIIESYDSTGAIVYYSSENIQYRYDTTIYAQATVEVVESGAGVSNYEYVLTKTDSNEGYTVKDSDGNIVSKNVYQKYLSVITYGNVLCIEMKQIALDFANGNFGGSRTFSVELAPNEDFTIGNETVKFEIYNALPSTLSLVSENSAVDVTGILGAGTAYAGAVIINYVYSVLKFDYEMLIMDPNGNISALLDQQKITENGTYKIIINYLGDIKGCGKSFEFTITNSDEFIYAVAIKLADGTYRNVSATGSGYTYDQGGVKTTISTHYILNGEFKFILNSNLYLTEPKVELGPIDNYTYIYKISNLDAPEADEGLITEYYSSYIAISVIPESGDILKRLVHYGGNIKENTDDLLSLSDPAITPYVTTKDEYNAGIRIAWSKYNLIPENTISVEVFYGDIDGQKYNAKIEEINSLNSITLRTSGTYYIRFQDKAGNVQLFGAYADNQYFTIKYLSSVIFEVQSETPINYAIYDTDVTVSVPDITLGYYDVNAKPIIHVELNGKTYTGYTKTAQYTWNFTERGLYKVWFTAKIDEKDIYEAPIYFTILSSKESRASYNYAGYTNYYIQDIKLEGLSVKDRLTNINNGELLTIDGEQYLKSLMLHASDIKTGTGYWTFVINTNNEFDQTFEFTIWINKATVPIKLSIENGGSTTDTIIVSFNASNVITASGDCILKITGYADLVLTEEKLANGELQEVYEISISQKGSYYIEVTSLSGQLLYSSYVVKAEPLNTISIIIIVVAVLVVGAGIVLFVLLRRKMKIR